MDADGGLMRFGALNAADPRTPIQRAREASGYDRMTSEERLAAHQRIAAELQRPGPAMTDAEMDAAEEEGASKVFAERYPGVVPVAGVDVEALVAAYEHARAAYEAGDGLDAPDTRTRRRGGVEAGIRAVLAAQAEGVDADEMAAVARKADADHCMAPEARLVVWCAKTDENYAAIAQAVAVHLRAEHALDLEAMREDHAEQIVAHQHVYEHLTSERDKAALALEQVTQERDRLRERMANVAERLRGLVLGFDRNVAPSWMGSIDHWGADMQSATTETLDYAADLIYAAQKDGGERG